MKIGILTFVNGLNYGAKLQCWALKCALTSYGHEVFVFDRRSSAKNTNLKGLLSFNPRGWVKFIISLILGCEKCGILTRTRRTIRFVKRLGLSPYSFVQWCDAPKDLGVDLIVVGSDQVWHCGDWGDPRPYLLEGAPDVKAISYAASFGLKAIPENYLSLYRHGLGRFRQISCRESEGVELCESLGYSATHVVDPTLLPSRDDWNQLITPTTGARTIFCYLLAEDIVRSLPDLAVSASELDCDVEVTIDYRSPFKTPRNLREWCQRFKRYPRVRVCRDYGPEEFVQGVANSTWVITDSFHALMFSAIFNKNVRFIRPTRASRKGMFARVEEFAEKCVVGPLFADSIRAALDSFSRVETIAYKYEEINKKRTSSEMWLKAAIGMV